MPAIITNVAIVFAAFMATCKGMLTYLCMSFVYVLINVGHCVHTAFEVHISMVYTYSLHRYKVMATTVGAFDIEKLSEISR